MVSTLRIRTWLVSIALGGVLAAQASAADFYVDAVGGSDANNGTSPALAWRTITHSLATLGTSSDTLHILPGTYSASGGEVFPLQAHGQRLVGDQGPEVTTIDGEGTTQSLLWTYFTVTAQALLPEVRGIHLTAGGAGIQVSGSWSVVSTEIRDVAIDGCGYGLRIEVGGSFGAASFAVTARSTIISGCAVGVGVGSSLSAASTLTLEDCSILSSLSDGILLAAGHNGGGVTANIRRCRIDQQALVGIHTTDAESGIDLAIEDCSITRNGAEGYRAEEALGLTRAYFVRSTIANNGSAGIYGRQASNYFHAVWLESSLVFGHGIDVDSNAVQTTSYSLIGVDPNFVDPTNGDFRLRFGSVAIDMADPTTPLGTLDLARRARPIDGTLDTQERADVGCYEFAPLTITTSGRIGTPLRFEMAGPTGNSISLEFTRHATVAPVLTPFGEFDLVPGLVGTVLNTNVSAFPPFVFQRPIPNNPLLIGRTFAFQGLVASSVAPNGFAYTNAVQFIVLP
jgi:hypothetical protein